MLERLKSRDWRLWTARFLIATVIGWNLQVAYIFLFSPESFISSFELSGIPGEAAVRGMAVLFVMWNIPYLVALWHPRRYRVSLYEAIAMQTVGLLGGSFILSTLGAGHALLHVSITRFIDSAVASCAMAKEGQSSRPLKNRPAARQSTNGGSGRASSVL